MLRKQPHGKWSEMDFLLYEAYCIYEQEHQTQSGSPVYMTRSGDVEIEWRIEEDVDYADEAMDKHKRDGRKRNGKNHDDGVKTAVIPYDRMTGKKVESSGLARERWYGMMAERIQEGEVEQTPQGRAVLPGSTVVVPMKKPQGGWDASQYG